DLKEAEANVVTAEAAVRAAQHQIDLREAERAFRAADLKRDQILFERKVIYEEVIDAARKNLRAAEVGVEAAKSDLAVVQSKLTAAKADVKVKEARINVARKEWEKAKAMAKFAEITAPFDGVIVDRQADVGTFVTNATSSARTKPFLTIMRLDKV